jgi:glycosyltransferase involved in cell wall biosynthesis
MVIISNGFSKFHLAVAAEELFKRSKLTMLITGAYPTGRARRILHLWPLKTSSKALRLLARGQKIDDRLVVPLWFPESMHALGQVLKNRPDLLGFVNFFNVASLKAYGRQATKHVLKAAKNGARVYHYRAGFGHESVQAAKAYGMMTICDYSIAHPALLEYLIQNSGRLPAQGCTGAISEFWYLVLRDTEQADYVLVNSEFVKGTFIHEGWDDERVAVIYLGVDDQFLEALESRPQQPSKNGNPIRFLFAGAFEKRKGADSLVEAFGPLCDVPWRLTIAGGAPKDILAKHRGFFADHRVEYKGLLCRAELARCMRQANVFVFPSLAEGSARVVFEALAAGCYVITTPNSGSIVQHGVHGRLVPPGDSGALAMTIRETISMGREAVVEVGHRNAKLIRDQYRQSHYGDKLAALYERLLGEN